MCLNVIHVIRKIYYKINLNESTCDLYTMDYISQSPTHCSKGNIECVLNCTKFPGKQASGYMSETNCSLMQQQYMKLRDGFQRKRGKNKHICPMFDNELLASSKQIKLCPRDYIFQSNRTTYLITTPCVLCLVG